MLHFTEGSTAIEDPAALHEEFAGQYDAGKFEKKVSSLMRNAYKRLQKEDRSGQRTWHEAIRRLKRGDHYLLVMWDQRPGLHGPGLIGFALGILLLGTLIGLQAFSRRVSPPNPRLLQMVFLVIVLAIALFPTAIGNAAGWLMDKTIMRWIGDDKAED